METVPAPRPRASGLKACIARAGPPNGFDPASSASRMAALPCPVGGIVPGDHSWGGNFTGPAFPRDATGLPNPSGSASLGPSRPPDQLSGRARSRIPGATIRPPFLPGLIPASVLLLASGRLAYSRRAPTMSPRRVLRRRLDRDAGRPAGHCSGSTSDPVASGMTATPFAARWAGVAQSAPLPRRRWAGAEWRRCSGGGGVGRCRHQGRALGQRGADDGRVQAAGVFDGDGAAGHAAEHRARWASAPLALRPR